MMEKQVFISYSGKDKTFADKLNLDLSNAGIKTWMDRTNILPGQNWQREISEAVTNSLAFLFLSSKHSTQSRWVKEETGVFIDSNPDNLVVPLILDDEGVSNLPPDLKDIQWIDFRMDYETGLQQLLKLFVEVPRETHPIELPKQKVKGYVFISYSEEDSNFADKIKIFLASRDYAYWDYRESDRDFHTMLFLELEKVIRGASATLSVLSPSWKESQWAIKEYIFSDEVNTPVFLLMAENIGPTLVIAGVPYIDFAKNQKDGFDRLERELERKGL